MTRLALFLVLIYFCLPCKAETLQATIQHVESLPSVPPQLQAGAQFDERLIPAPSRSKWFPVPAWLAGYWQRERIKQKVLGFMPLSFQDIRTRKFGYQVDRSGVHWHWVHYPFHSVSDRASTIGLFLGRDESLLSEGSDSATIRTIWTSWTVDKATGIIRKVEQGDQIDTFQLAEPGFLDVTSSCQGFDSFGRRTSVVKASWKERDVRPFNPIHSENGIDVRQLFVDFMYSTGREDLL